MIPSLMHNSTQHQNHIAANSTIVKIRNNIMAIGGAQAKVISVCIVSLAACLWVIL